MSRIKSRRAALRIERRRFARFDVHWPVEYPLFGEVAFANTENISRGGMLVAGVPILPEEDVEFSLHGVGTNPVIITGRVCRRGDSGTHVEFVDASGDPGPILESFIEKNVIPGLIGSLTGERRDTHNLRLVSSWYKELGKEDRALDVCRGAIAGATSPGPYEELAELLLLRAKRVGVHGGSEYVHEARQVIGQGLKVVASPVLVRLYQESTRIEERLLELEARRTTLERDIQAELESTTSQRPIPPDLLAEARRTDLDVDEDMPTDPMVPVGAITDPSLVMTDPSLLPPGLVVTDPAVPLAQTTVEEVAAAFAAADDRPLTDPMLAPPAPRTTETVYEVSGRRRGRLLAFLLVVGVGVVGVVAWRLDWIQIPALDQPELAHVESVPEPEPDLEELPLAALAEPAAEIYDEPFEPDLLAKPPEERKRMRRKKRRVRKPRTAASSSTVEASEPESAPTSPAGDRYARAKQYIKDRKILLAIEELEALVGDKPRHAQALRMLGVAYNLVGREESSIDAFRRFIQIAPGHKDAAKVRAIIEAYENKNP